MYKLMTYHVYNHYNNIHAGSFTLINVHAHDTRYHGKRLIRDLKTYESPFWYTHQLI